MKKYRVWIIVGVLLLTLIVLAVWASSQTPKVDRSSEMWSRGQVIGSTSVKRRAALRTASDGSAFLIWQNMGGRLELAHIGTDGQVLLTHVLPIGAGESSDPQLEIGADGRLRMLWREGEYPDSTVHFVLLEADGTLVSRPQTLSNPVVSVLDAPRLIADEGRYHAIWADDDGIQWAMLDGEGALLAEPTLVTAQGRFPSAQLDERGRLHLIWQWQLRSHVEAIYYVALDPQDAGGAVAEPVEIAELILRTGQGLGEPVVALTPDMVYVFWVVRDFKYVASEGQYVSFPLGSPQQNDVEPLPLRYGRYPEGLYLLRGPQTPLQVALSAGFHDPDVDDVVRSQVAVLALGQGGAREQVVTASTQASLKPVLVADRQANLHLVWLESTEFGRYRVVYGSTAPGVMKTYNTLSLWDVLDSVFSNVFLLATMLVAVVAVVIMWALLPFLVLVIFHLVTSEEVLGTARALWALIVALTFEVALTFIQPPRIGVEADWALLPWVAPGVSALVSALVLARTARGREHMHLFVAYFLFTATNIVLQMLLYFLF